MSEQRERAVREREEGLQRPARFPFELVTVVLTDLGDDRTEMLFEQRGSMPPEEYERATEGWSTFFDRLQERLSAA